MTYRLDEKASQAFLALTPMSEWLFRMSERRRLAKIRPSNLPPSCSDHMIVGSVGQAAIENKPMPV